MQTREWTHDHDAFGAPLRGASVHRGTVPHPHSDVVARVRAALLGDGNLGMALAALGEATAAHADAAEVGEAPYSDVAFTSGRHTWRLERLLESYRQVSREALDLSRADSVSQLQVEDLCRRVAEIEHRDTDMVLDAFWTDIGTGD